MIQQSVRRAARQSAFAAQAVPRRMSKPIFVEVHAHSAVAGESTLHRWWRCLFLPFAKTC